MNTNAALRDKMVRALEGEDVEVAIAMLDLFGRDEAVWAIPHVLRLLARSDRRNSGTRLAEKARECFETLQEIAEAADTERNRLLRPSRANEGGSLLRPTSGFGEEGPDRLLRASEDGA